jgi:Flp pilus assembly protein TadD
MQLGVVLMRQARLKEAVDPLKRSTELQPDLATAHYYLGEVYNRLDQLPLALATLETAATLQPGNWRAYKAIGNVLDRMGRPAEAAAAHRRAREAQKR